MTDNAPSEQQITDLAKSLKKMHLAASFDEAYARAKEILGTPKTAENLSVQEMAHDITSLRAELEATNSALSIDEKEHAAEVDDATKTGKLITQSQENLDIAKKEVERIDKEIAALQGKLDKKK